MVLAYPRAQIMWRATPLMVVAVLGTSACSRYGPSVRSVAQALPLTCRPGETLLETDTPTSLRRECQLGGKPNGAFIEVTTSTYQQHNEEVVHVSGMTSGVFDNGEPAGLITERSETRQVSNGAIVDAYTAYTLWHDHVRVAYDVWTFRDRAWEKSIEQRWSTRGTQELARKWLNGLTILDVVLTNGTGTIRQREASGEQALQGQCARGLRDGTWTVRTASGELVATRNYQAGILHGPSRDAYGRGGEFVHGTPVGQWHFYQRGHCLEFGPLGSQCGNRACLKEVPDAQYAVTFDAFGAPGAIQDLDCGALSTSPYCRAEYLDQISARDDRVYDCEHLADTDRSEYLLDGR
jgi:hypothetical protein